MELKHTPGTWILKEQGDANEFAIITDENKWVVAFKLNGEQRLEEERANAKLMANAPIMLETLKSVNQYFVNLQNKVMLTTHDENVWKLVAKTIKEATDEAN